MSWQLLYDEWWATITFAVSFVFVVYYGFCAPWYRTPFGRALIAIDFGLALATFPAALYFMLGVDIEDNSALVWVTTIVAPVVPIAIAYRIITMWRFRRNGRE